MGCDQRKTGGLWVGAGVGASLTDSSHAERRGMSQHVSPINQDLHLLIFCGQTNMSDE